MFPIIAGKDYAVITGDIIDSSSYTAPERKQLSSFIREVTKTLTDWLGEEVVSPVAIFGGDSWQLLLSNPRFAMQAALFMRASLMATPLQIQTRMVIAIGSVDFVPEAETNLGIEEADGEAFRLSGRTLNEGMGKRRTMQFVHPDDEVTARWDLVCHLVDSLIQTNWTDNRARAVSGALRGLTGVATGELWPVPVSQQTVSRHLNEANWDTIEPVLESWSNYFN